MINKLNVNDTFHDCVRNADFKIISVNKDHDTFMVQGIVNEEIVSQKKRTERCSDCFTYKRQISFLLEV